MKLLLTLFWTCVLISIYGNVKAEEENDLDYDVLDQLDPAMAKNLKKTIAYTIEKFEEENHKKIDAFANTMIQALAKLKVDHKKGYKLLQTKLFMDVDSFVENSADEDEEEGAEDDSNLEKTENEKRDELLDEEEEEAKEDDLVIDEEEEEEEEEKPKKKKKKSHGEKTRVRSKYQKSNWRKNKKKAKKGKKASGSGFDFSNLKNMDFSGMKDMDLGALKNMIPKDFDSSDMKLPENFDLGKMKNMAKMFGVDPSILDNVNMDDVKNVMNDKEKIAEVMEQLKEGKDEL